MDNLRPIKLDEIIGQSNIVDRLKISVGAARQENRPFPHLLISGSPGIGKTTLVGVLANEMNAQLHIANGGNVRTIKLLAPYLMKLNFGDILFIDEIHRLTMMVSEWLYPILEDFRVDLSTEHETSTINLQPFTLIGATTESGNLAPPLYDRFTYKYTLSVYGEEELSKIIQVNAEKLNINMVNGACETIAKRSRGTPRIANSYLRWIKDYAISKNVQTVDCSVVNDAMKLAKVDEKGLTDNDRKYLHILKKIGQPIGIKTISASTNIAVDTIEETIEPFLLRLGLILKTPKGRILI
jgi:Holliday junction DNA helicase RuvB